MLSLIIVIMILGMVSTTSTAMKNEITTMVGWYERSNIGDNMLDLIMKTPGSPDNWETNPSSMVQLGLENPDYPDTIDYNKIEALNEAYQNNDEALKEALSNLSLGKDFSLGFFLTRIEIEGDVTVVPPTTEGSVDVPSGGHLSITPVRGYAYGRGIYAEWIDPERVDLEGVGNIPNVINISAGETFVFKLIEGGSVRVDVPGGGSPGGPVNYEIPTGVTVHIEVETGYLLIGWAKLDNGTYELWIPYHRQGQQVRTTWEGTVWWGQQGGVSSSDLVIKYIYATEVVHADYNITLINGEFVNDPDEIKASMDRSPWVTYSERRVPMSKMIYSSQYTVTPSDLPKEMYVGTLTTTVPDYMSFKIEFSDPGYVVLVAWLRGTNVSGYSVLAAYRTEEDPTMKAIINQTINGNNVVHYYSSPSPDYIVIPWNDFLTTVKQGESLDIYVWVYKMKDVNVMQFIDLNGINTLMKPQVSLAVLRLSVWDDS
ncbi:hypothetical protein CL1_0772 [Thermococcus cleftensis]|uniref:Uncharacterized protein n=2 Tax=Thermococcaceae TaxID=2259 RepID=I3ZTE3_THECF|nr:hypothetical protein CL1_0772 [Thermococcus cleftensis]